MNSLIRNLISILDLGSGHFFPGAGRRASDDSAGDSIDLGMKAPRSMSSAELRHRSAGILYADIADYVRLLELGDEGILLRLVEAMKIANTHVALSGGRVAHYAGDAILAEFEDADSALNCAIELQLAVREWNADIERDHQVQFRIGVNFGDVISDRGDIYGNAVNLAARLEKLAASGGICVSESVRRIYENDASIRFIAERSQRSKSIGQAVNFFLIDLDAQQVVEKNFTCAVKVSTVTS